MPQPAKEGSDAPWQLEEKAHTCKSCEQDTHMNEKDLMPELQQLKRQFPELFEGPLAFEVYAQEAAVVDNSIACWQLEAFSEKYPG